MLSLRSLITPLTVSLVAAAFVACSSNVKKADIPNDANPHDEIAKLHDALGVASTKNIDVLAAKEYRTSEKYYDQAHDDLASKKANDKILDDVRKGRGALDQAYETAAGREALAPAIFQARQGAIGAGARDNSDTNRALTDLDKRLVGEADHLDRVSADQLVSFQSAYVDLERRAVINSQLGNAKNSLNAAEKNKARKRAPSSYKNAEVAIKNAESLISANVRNPAIYQAAVSEANRQTNFLLNVMTVINSHKNMTEDGAIQIVQQNEQINSLQSNVSATQQKTAAEQAENARLAAELAMKNKNLQAASSQVEMQRAIEQARQQFSADEAEAFQQGDKLIVRMKNVNFASGRSDLPGAAIAELSKVSDIAKSLNASEIEVQGHTDSVGSASVNKEISEKRADAVASYFKSNGFKEVDAKGYGFEKPIASNKSKQGRAQNRRVDIVITPGFEETTAQ